VRESVEQAVLRSSVETLHEGAGLSESPGESPHAKLPSNPRKESTPVLGYHLESEIDVVTVFPLLLPFVDRHTVASG
jgi:hypothetical protein